MKKISKTQIFIYFLLFLVTLVMLVPILHIVAISFSNPLKVAQISAMAIFPKGFSLINYQVLLSNKLILKSIFNSVFITVAGTSINLILTTMAAYTLTRTGLLGKKFFMVIVIIVMVFEPGLVPQYLLIKQLGLIDNYLSVILFKGVDVFYLIILMRFFEDVPESLIEAAKIDGAGDFKIFYNKIYRIKFSIVVC